RVLAEAGVAPDSLRDPWGTPYRAEFAVERELDVLRLWSAGADKKVGSEDDWHVVASRRPYFRPTGELMARAVEDYRRRANSHLTGPEALKRELLGAHQLDFDKLRDRWGRAYALRFAVSGAHYVFRVTSAGPDGRLDPEPRPYGSDDFEVWAFSTDYFAETRALAYAAVAASHVSRGTMPKDDAQLRDLLRAGGLSAAQLRDHWGRDYYAAFRSEVRYADRVEGAQAGDEKRVAVTPVTRKIDFVTLRSAGPDGARGTPDDFTVADFSAVASEQSAADKAPPAVAPVTTFSGATGAITGTVIDPQGAVVPNATVTATHQQESLSYTAATDEDGKYVLRNLRSGLYRLRAQAAGFKDVIVVDVPVRASALAQFDLRLDLGTVSETVEIVASQVQDLANTSSMSLLALKPGVAAKAAPGAPPPVQTPRLRKDFPETLYWQPELLTDEGGRAQLKFKLADNITTWKVSAIASTATGELGTAEREIRAFRPFFVEHDPPRVLTEGDEISLPVVLRNYLERPQRVAVSVKPEDWFTLLGPAEKSADVAAGDASRETFDLRATASVKEGKQRVTAVAPDSSDAVERGVHVHPDGEEIAQTETRLLGADGAALEALVPAEAVARSARAELKVYPNLMAHAFESVEAIMSRPNGCGEQTVSSAYPSLLVLRHHAGAGGDSPQRAALITKARRYLQIGYDRLLSYRTADGGFAYWTDGPPDVALTAYALRFLRDAARFVEVDEGVPEGARRWLASRQRPDGSWPAPEWVEKYDTRRAALLTAYVARVLAEHPPATQTDAQQQTAEQRQSQTQADARPAA
ncbi:MAG TPA: alpha-2-macroglobulin family protein, partial [Pyrinomonadaceae bacterium]